MERKKEVAQSQTMSSEEKVDRGSTKERKLGEETLIEVQYG